MFGTLFKSKMTFSLVLVTLIMVVGLLFAPSAFSQMKALTVEKAWVRPTPPGTKNTAMYAQIHNMGAKADRLVAASTDKAKVVEIHQVTMKDGMMQMSPLAGGLPIPAKGMAQLKPGGYHLMVIGLHSPVKKGEMVSFELTFEKAGKVRVKAVAEMRMAPMKGMSHGKQDKMKPGMKMKK